MSAQGVDERIINVHYYYHTIARREERGVETRNARRSSLKGRERDSDMLPHKHWNTFKGNTQEASERRDEAHVGFCERCETNPNGL